MTWKRATLTAACAVAALLIAAGCAGAGTDHSSSHNSPEPTSASAAPGSGDHNDADVMFVQHMIPHHQQAVAMSDIVLGKQGIDPRVTDLAKQIKAAQGPEINQMQGWLGQWGNPSMAPMTSQPSGGHDMGAMSGMMSDDQMAALKNAEGVDASRLFLTGMITHHQGAIDMAQTEIKDGRFPAAIDLARSIVTTQQREIDTMKGILQTL